MIKVKFTPEMLEWIAQKMRYQDTGLEARRFATEFVHRIWIGGGCEVKNPIPDLLAVLRQKDALCLKLYRALLLLRRGNGTLHKAPDGVYTFRLDEFDMAQVEAALAEVAPEVCQPYGDSYDIGPYRFSFLSDGALRASTGNVITEARPALAWLRDALELAIEARGWYWDISRWPPSGYKSEVATYKGRAKTSAEALLAALLAAVREEG